MSAPIDVKNLAGLIDHTLLKPAATLAEVEQLCREALEHRFASVCVNPSWVETCAAALKGSAVAVCTVVGFPLGATTSESKAFETREAVARGANEIDMVINVGRLKGGDFEYVCRDIRRVVEAADRRIVKVIIETSLLTEEEKVTACVLSKAAGAHFVKTSTGFNGGGATTEDIALMRRVVGPVMGVKASGGVRDRAAAEAMVAAGATRLGTSSGLAIVRGTASQSTY
jgi:deoxyribose-phosphate aldolase